MKAENSSSTPRESFQRKARTRVYEYVTTHLDKTDAVKLPFDEVYVVWFCKTLQNWKCLISTTLPDGMYYEVTYDGARGFTYLDVYKKFDNIEIQDGAGHLE
jgi:hypothetical protein